MPRSRPRSSPPRSRSAPSRRRHVLDALFAPRAVAVIGASRVEHRIGHQIVANLVGAGFTGPVHPVNPTAEVVRSMRCVPRVTDVPGDVDLAVIAIPARHVAGAIDDCGRKGVRAVVVITAGFAEVGPAGARRQEDLVARCRRHGMRLVGPNCMGIVNTDPAVRLNASFAASRPLPGGAAFLSQSGALGEAILADSRSQGLGLSMFASLGNRADVSPADLLDYWAADPRTTQILMYLEGFGDPEGFMAAARRASAVKPILVMKSGRTARGAAAAMSHTGALAGSEAAVDSLLAQCGVVRVDTMNHLFALARAVQADRFPKGRRVGIVTNAGGPAILATDACIAAGLEIGDLSESTRRRLKAHLPDEASVANPVDLIASGDAAAFDRALPVVLADRRVDMVLAIFVSPVMIDASEVAAVFAKHASATSKPMITCMLGRDHGHQALATLREAGVPHYRFPEEAARALAGLADLEAMHGRAVEPARRPRVDRARGRAAVDHALASGRTTLKGTELDELLAAYRIPVVPSRTVHDREEALAAAEAIGYPLVAKLVAPDVEHKTDIGGVLLDLRTREDVADAHDRLVRRFGRAHPDMSVLLQTMRDEGVETFFGAATDAQLGRMLAFGLGGIHVEVFKDVVFRLHPLSLTDARDMVAGIRGRALLRGVRGRPPVDEDQLVDVLMRLNRMLTDLPEIAELDLNPFLAAWEPRDSCVLDARVRLEPREDA